MMTARRQFTPFVLVLLVFLVACGSTTATQQAALTTSVAPPATETLAPPTASPLAPTATPGVTVTASAVAPSATSAPPPTPTPNYVPPTPTRAAVASPTATRASATGPTPAPASAVPAGWQVYRSKYLPIVVAFPPGWTYDDSAYKQGRWEVDFSAPQGTPGAPYVSISSKGAVAVDPNIDVQRDSYAKLVTQTCAQSGVENTRDTTVSTIAFATLTATCDHQDGNDLLVYDISSGLYNNVFWYLQARSSANQFSTNGTQYFLPMLQTLNIYSNPPGVPPGGYHGDFSTWATGTQGGGRASIAAGAYHLQSTMANNPVDSYNPGGGIGYFADFTLDVDVEEVSGPSNPSDSTYAGVYFRVQPQGQDYTVGTRYLFYITPDGFYGFSLVNADGSVTTLVTPTPSAAIRKATGSNHLTITCQGAGITLQINGTTVTTQRATIVTPGRIGLYVATSPAAPNAEFAFSNLQITEVP